MENGRGGAICFCFPWRSDQSLIGTHVGTTMRLRFFRLSSAFGLLWCCLLIGCQDFGESFAIRNRRFGYEKWLVTQRPFLAGPTEAVVYRRGFSLNCENSRNRPIIVYYLKAGDWAGLLVLDFWLEVDDKGQPIGISEEHLAFVCLPASQTSTDDKGQRWNGYYGIMLDPKQMQEMVRRAVADDQFEDIADKVKRPHITWARSVLVDCDDWKYLTRNRR